MLLAKLTWVALWAVVNPERVQTSSINVNQILINICANYIQIVGNPVHQGRVQYCKPNPYHQWLENLGKRVWNKVSNIGIH